jgi:hypothetical protein
MGKYSKALTAGLGAGSATYASLQAGGHAEWINVAGALVAAVLVGGVTYGVPNDIVEQVKRYIADAHDIVRALPPIPDPSPAKPPTPLGPVTMTEMDTRGVQLNEPAATTVTSATAAPVVPVPPK